MLHFPPTLGPPQQQQPEQSARPPLSPALKGREKGLAPPSTGKAAKNQPHPRKAPSSDEGKGEGLDHVSDDDNVHMQCTSSPASVELLKILEEAVNAQQNGTLDEKFQVAAYYVLHARSRLTLGTVPEGIGENERFFTGAMANAINAVIKDGYCVLHQACLGAGAMHSDLSATCISTTDEWPSTLMVGEGRWSASDLRKDTRGQMLNELLRHRLIDSEGKKDPNYGPILLVAFDKIDVEIDLAFPSTKGGKLEDDQVVNFPACTSPHTETFGLYEYYGLRLEMPMEKPIYPLCCSLFLVPWRNCMLGGAIFGCSKRFPCPLEKLTWNV